MSSTIYQGLVQFGNKDEDSSENPFIWGKLITLNPVDVDGNPVKNAGSFMIYSAKGMVSGSTKRVVVTSRGLAGLYDLVQPEDLEEILTELEITVNEIPLIPVAETTAKSSVSREDASKKAREARQARRGAKSVVATPVMETAAQPE